MPRETIGYDGNRTVVKWRKDDELAEFPGTPGHVQIGTIDPTAEADAPTGGLFADLDADQIDYLIAVLRKARRQAYPSRETQSVQVTQNLPNLDASYFADMRKRAQDYQG